MVPFLFLVASATTDNLTTSGEPKHGKNNNKGTAPQHVRLNNTDPLILVTKSHYYSLQSSLLPKIWILWMFCSTVICLITAFCEPLLLPDHNELQQPWTIIYSSLCVSINTPNSWLCVCESPLTGSHLLLDTLTGWNGWYWSRYIKYW